MIALKKSLRAAPLAVLVSSTACLSGGPAASMLHAPEWLRKEKCTAFRQPTQPLVVEWSNEDRARLEALASRGPIAVHYVGCELRVLPTCRAPASFTFTRTNTKHSLEHITDENDLHAKLPFGAAALEGTLQAAGELNVKMATVGRFGTDRVHFRTSELEGECKDATHIVTGMIVGAFEFYSGSEASAGMSGSVFSGGAGIGSKASKHSLTRDGELKACDEPWPSTAPVATTPPPPPPPPSPPALPPDPDAAPSTEPAPDPLPEPIATSAPALTPTPAPSPAPAIPPSAPRECSALLQLELTPLPELETKLAEQRREYEAAYEEAKDSAGSRRTTGWIFSSIGVASAGTAGLFAYLGSRQNSEIQDGNLATRSDIEDVESTGKTYNALGYVFGVAGVAGLGLGTSLILLNPAPERETTIEVGSATDIPGVSLRVRH